MFRGSHKDVIPVPAQEIRSDFFFTVPLCQSFSDDAPHLLGEGGSRFPDIFGLTDRTAKRLGNLAHLNIQIRFVLHLGE